MVCIWSNSILGALTQDAVIQVGVFISTSVVSGRLFFFLSNLDVFVKEQMLLLSQWVWQGHLAGEQAVLLNSSGHN